MRARRCTYVGGKYWYPAGATLLPRGREVLVSAGVVPRGCGAIDDPVPGLATVPSTELNDTQKELDRNDP